MYKQVWYKLTCFCSNKGTRVLFLIKHVYLEMEGHQKLRFNLSGEFLSHRFTLNVMILATNRNFVQEKFPCFRRFFDFYIFTYSHSVVNRKFKYTMHFNKIGFCWISYWTHTSLSFHFGDLTVLQLFRVTHKGLDWTFSCIRGFFVGEN